ncbi:MAG TPA: hypothetical protein QF800_01500 [Phycisphaerales bacterium]|nr:hypothetical protein [Phycisphaerales bacterium]
MQHQTQRSRDAVRQARSALRGMELAVRKARFARSGGSMPQEDRASNVDHRKYPRNNPTVLRTIGLP